MPRRRGPLHERNACVLPAGVRAVRRQKHNKREEEYDRWLLKELLKEKGNDAFRSKDFAGAIRWYSEAIDADRGNHILWANRAVASLQAGAFADATADAKQCILLRPSYVKGWFLLYKAAEKSRQWQAACAAIRGGAKHDTGAKPVFTPKLRRRAAEAAYVARAEAAIGAGKAEEAVALAKAGQEIDFRNEALADIAQRARVSMNSGLLGRVEAWLKTTRHARGLKQDGNALFKDDQFEAAVPKYTVDPPAVPGDGSMSVDDADTDWFEQEVGEGDLCHGDAILVHEYPPAVIRPHPPPPGGLSHAVLEWQSNFMAAPALASSVEYAPGAPPIVALHADARDDCLAVALALLQCVPPIAAVCRGTPLGDLLLRLRAHGAASRYNTIGLTDVQCLTDLFGEVGGLSMLQFKIYQFCDEALTKCEPQVGPICPAPVRTVEAVHRIKIPPGWRQGETFKFSRSTPSGYRSWTLTPGADAQPNDVLACRLRVGESDPAQPFLAGRSLDDRILEEMQNATPNVASYSLCTKRVASHTSGCRACTTESYSVINQDDFRGISVPGGGGGGGRLEHMLHDALASDQPCSFCQRTGARGWVYHGAHDDDAGYWHKTEDWPPKAPKSHTFLLTLPQAFFIEVGRDDYSQGYANATISFACVDFPMKGLDLSPYFDAQCPPPQGACTVYDVCFIGKRQPVAFDVAKLREAPSIPLANDGSGGRFMCYSKSMKDGRWYLTDVCCASGPKHCSELQRASRVSSMSVELLVYVRRDCALKHAEGPCEAKEQAQREAKQKAERAAAFEAEREARAKAWREAEEQAQRETQQKAERAAAAGARREAKAERKARAQAERAAQARRKAEEQARRKAKRKAERKAERKSAAEVERKALEHAEREAQSRREAQARREQEEQAQREANQEAERAARREADERNAVVVGNARDVGVIVIEGHPVDALGGCDITTYKPVGKVSNGCGVWKQLDASRFLYRADDDHWCVSTRSDMKQGRAAGVWRFCVADGALTPDHTVQALLELRVMDSVLVRRACEAGDENGQMDHGAAKGSNSAGAQVQVKAQISVPEPPLQEEEKDGRGGDEDESVVSVDFDAAVQAQAHATQRLQADTTDSDRADLEAEPEPEWWTRLDAGVREALHKLAESSSAMCSMFICPCTHEIMRRPAMLNASDSHRLEYGFLCDWVRSGSGHHPVTGTVLVDASVMEDAFLARQIRNWVEDEAARLNKADAAARSESAAMAAAAMSRPRKLHVFIDDSNISLGAKRNGRAMDVARLVARIHRDRQVVERHIAGSGPGKHEYWAQWRRAGYRVHQDPRCGKEAFVDDVLGAQLATTVNRDYGESRIIALATGDGNDNSGRASFPEHVQNALKRGWCVELYTWRQSTNAIYHGFAREYSRSGRFKIFYCDAIGFGHAQ